MATQATTYGDSSTNTTHSYTTNGQPNTTTSYGYTTSTGNANINQNFIKEQEELAENGSTTSSQYSNTNGYINGTAAGNSNSLNGAVGGLSSRNPAGHSSNWDYGGNPLAHINTGMSARLPPFAGYLQPGLYRPPRKDFANPAPLGLAAFAFTTFLLSLINWHTRDVTEPNIVVGAAFAYGGLVQLLAGMWEMASGNTFGATALSSYGGFWISFAIVLTPGGFDIAGAYTNPVDFNYALGFFLAGWFIFTFLLWICTLKSTVAFSFLFFTLWMTFLLLSISYILTPNVTGGAQHEGLQKAGGMFGLLAAFAAWYVALAGIADDSNSFFTIPVWHFPWSDKGREARQAKKETEDLNPGE